jgi:hypothetical protein
MSRSLDGEELDYAPLAGVRGITTSRSGTILVCSAHSHVVLRVATPTSVFEARRQYYETLTPIADSNQHQLVLFQGLLDSAQMVADDLTQLQTALERAIATTCRFSYQRQVDVLLGVSKLRAEIWVGLVAGAPDFLDLPPLLSGRQFNEDTFQRTQRALASRVRQLVLSSNEEDVDRHIEAILNFADTYERLLEPDTIARVIKSCHIGLCESVLRLLDETLKQSTFSTHARVTTSLRNAASDWLKSISEQSQSEKHPVILFLKFWDHSTSITQGSDFPAVLEWLFHAHLSTVLPETYKSLDLSEVSAQPLDGLYFQILLSSYRDLLATLTVEESFQCLKPLLKTPEGVIPERYLALRDSCLAEVGCRSPFHPESKWYSPLSFFFLIVLIDCD